MVGAVDEEGDSLGARALVSHYQPDFAIIGEPGGWDRLTLGYKGSAWAEVRWTRSLAHTAHRSESACEAAFHGWGSLQAWAQAFNEDRPRLFDQVLLSLRAFDSGEDGFSGWAALRFGARLPLDLDPPAWYAHLRSAFPEAAVTPTGFPLPAYRAEKNTPLVRAFLTAIRRHQGQPGFVLKTGTADLNLVAPAWGCPALAYGPGDSALDHTPAEHISLSDYRRSIAVLADVLANLR